MANVYKRQCVPLLLLLFASGTLCAQSHPTTLTQGGGLEALRNYAAGVPRDALKFPVSVQDNCGTSPDVRFSSNYAFGFASEIDGHNYLWHYAMDDSGKFCAVLDYPVAQVLSKSEHEILVAGATRAGSERKMIQGAAKVVGSLYGIAPGRCSEGRQVTNLALATSNRYLIARASSAALAAGVACAHVGSHLVDTAHIIKQIPETIGPTGYRGSDFAVIALQDSHVPLSTSTLGFDAAYQVIQLAAPPSNGTDGIVKSSAGLIYGAFAPYSPAPLLALRWGGRFPPAGEEGPIVLSDAFIATSAAFEDRIVIATYQGRESSPSGQQGVSAFTHYIGSRLRSIEAATYQQALSAPLSNRVNLDYLEIDYSGPSRPATLRVRTTVNGVPTGVVAEPLSWYSNRQGLLGTAIELNVPSLQLGEHRITAVRPNTIWQKTKMVTLTMPPDSYEIDNFRSQAVTLYEGTLQDHTLDATDVDWTIFAVGPGVRATVEVTSETSNSVGLQLHRQLNYPDGPVEQVSQASGNVPAGQIISVANTAPNSGPYTVYYVRAASTSAGTGYRIRVRT